MLPVKSFSVSIFILKPDDGVTKVLLLRRTGYLAGLWCQIAGGIEAGEKAWQTAIREVREETGLDVSQLWSADLCMPYYKADKNYINLVPVFVAFVPENSKVTLNDEHDNFEWVSFEKANAVMSFPRQRKALSEIKAEFVDKAPNPHLKIELNG